MQLILHSEAKLAIERDMATVDSTQTEKIANGGIEELKENGIGNKENIEDGNSINDDKQIINEDNALADVLIDKNIENNVEDKANAVDTVKEEDIIKTISVDTGKEEICDESSPNKEFNDCAQIEESQNNGTEEIDSIDITKNEAENKTNEKSEDFRKDEEDIIRIKEENFSEIGTAEKELENTIAKNDKIAVKEELPVTKEDIEVIEEVAEVTTPCETATDAKLEEKTKKEMEETEPSSKNKDLDGSKNITDASVCNLSKTLSCNNIQDTAPIELKDDIDEEELANEKKNNNQDAVTATKDSKSAPVNNIIDKPVLCKLSNTLDILSDDEEEPPKEEAPVAVESNEKQCINIEDDDDIMLIDEDTSKTETQPTQPVDKNKETPMNLEVQTDSETGEKTVDETSDLFAKTEEKESTPPADINGTKADISINEKEEKDVQKKDTPLLPDHFLKTAKKNLSDMTREDLEEFCVLKIVESIVDRSNLSEIKNKLKTMAQGIEEYRKKAMMLTKQNRDLQVVLKSVQEEQKNMTPGTAITPLKITRSVGMQVFMEKTGARRKSQAQLQTQQIVANPNSPINRQNARNASNPSPRPQKPPATSTNQPIPVPRLVPANSPAIKTPNTIPLLNQMTPTKTASPIPNGIKNPSPVQKVAEKRHHNRIMSVTVDLTDDEPPTKINNRTSPAPPVRLVPPQNLMATPRQPFGSSVSSPRKVYIPISGPQNQAIRPGQTIMLKPVNAGLKPRNPMPPVARAPSGPVRVNRMQTARHPAPLPDAMKQYQPPNWKALPPAPDLKLSKVENGIVISWKIEGYQEDSYEEIASYQLYAYQETSSPASTALWKKIGDVKALPLPMACTLTQFMAGFKYYFAVRAVDIRSRLGPFSLPGSILLLNKL